MREKHQALHLLAEKGFRPDLVLDIGAAGGTIGLYEEWLQAHYVLVEPLEKYRAALSRICQDLSSAEVEIAAVGAEPGQLSLAAHPTEPHLIGMPETAPSDWVRFSVPMITVDQIIAKQRQEKSIGSTLVKIDVDGPELAVLRGARQSLREGRDVYLIEAALLDTDRGRFGEIIEFMSVANYEVFDILEPLFRPSDEVLWQVDLIFVPRFSASRRDRRYF